MTNNDPSTEAARVAQNATNGNDSLPADVLAAWAEWCRGIKGVDERGWTLLRAAFEAGVEAGRLIQSKP